MSDSENKSPAEVVRTKRLEIVDDDGRVRAVLGIDEAGVTSLSLFDQSQRLRASLDASEVSEQMNGLGFFDTNGGLQIAMGAYAISEKGSRLFFNDTDGKHRCGLGVYEDGQAGLSFSAAKKDRHIKIAALKDGNLHLMLTESGAPRAALGLADSENRELSPDLALFDKDGRAGVVISGGSRSDPHLRLADRRHKVRGFFGLGVGGEPRLYVADEEGKPIDPRNAFERVVADRAFVYQALFFAAVLIAGGIGGAWMANTASLSAESLPAALITVVVLVALAGLLFVAHRRGW